MTVPAAARPGRERAEILVVVKAYPVRTDGHGEAVCVAGVRLDTPKPEWIRVFPVPFRRLPPEQQFAKYDVIRLDLVRGSDSRPESWEPRADTIEVVGHRGTDRAWSARRDEVEPLLVPSMCHAQRQQAADGTSLAVFRPGPITGWTVEAAPPPADRGTQLDMFEPSLEALEEIPYKFRYRYTCRDEPGCQGHHQRLLDWELGQSYRSWRGKYGDEQAALGKIRHKWAEQVTAADRDVMLYVGTIARYPQSFCALGVFWPPPEPAMRLF
jgi:hypothetical protein